MPANGSYFVTYEMLMKSMNPGGGASLWSSIVSGGFAGITYWLFGMPADVLKSRLQTAPEGTYKHGIREVFKQTMKTDGPLALYKGVIPVMIRAFPANAACFFGIELANKCFELIAPEW